MGDMGKSIVGDKREIHSGRYGEIHSGEHGGNP